VGIALTLVVAAAARADDTDAAVAQLAQKVREALAGAAPKADAEFRAPVDGSLAFDGALEHGLQTCDRVDLEVRVAGPGQVSVRAWPRVKGTRLDCGGTTDAAELARRLQASAEALTPFAWVADEPAELCARATLTWSDDTGPGILEGILRSVSHIDAAVKDILPLIPQAERLPPEELDARLRDAAAADVPKRAKILAEIAASLPVLTPSLTPGSSVFRKLELNTHGALFDAFRFRVPADAGNRRLVWAFGYPPGTVKGWFIVPVSGDAPQFKRFHQAPKLADTGVAEGDSILLQRSETPPLHAGSEYVIWFQFKVDTPVAMYFALGCFPFASTDGNTPAALMEALGLKEEK